MAVLGRILQIVGWLWIGASFFGNFIDLPNFGFFPGLILVFVSRILRVQSRRRQPSEDEEGPVDVDVATPTPRPLYTERSKQTAGTAQTEPVTRAPSKSAPPRSQVVWPKDEIGSETEPDDLIEKILVAGFEPADDKSDKPGLEPTYEGKPLTSAEMIERARQRWDRKP